MSSKYRTVALPVRGTPQPEVNLGLVLSRLRRNSYFSEDGSRLGPAAARGVLSTIWNRAGGCQCAVSTIFSFLRNPQSCVILNPKRMNRCFLASVK